MIIPPGTAITAVFITLDANRVLAAPSSGPTAVVYRNGQVDGTTSTTITNVSTGVYRITLTPSASTYAEGDYLAVVVTATVSSNAISQVVIQERLTGQLDAVEELQDQIAASQLTTEGVLTEVNLRAASTNNAVTGTGVAVSTLAIAAIQAAIEADPQMQNMMALIGISGGNRTSSSGGVDTYVINKPGGGTLTVTHNTNTGSWTVS